MKARRTLEKEILYSRGQEPEEKSQKTFKEGKKLEIQTDNIYTHTHTHINTEIWIKPKDYRVKIVKE